jgi:hypothetical protein
MRNQACVTPRAHLAKDTASRAASAWLARLVSPATENLVSAPTYRCIGTVTVDAPGAVSASGTMYQPGLAGYPLVGLFGGAAARP